MQSILLILLCQFSLDPSVIWELPEPEKGGDTVSPSSALYNVGSALPHGAGEGCSLRMQYWGAEWCGPCRQTLPQAQQACRDLGIKLEYFDYDKNKELAASLKISSLPTICFVVDDKIVVRNVGYISAADIVSKMNTVATVPGKSLTNVTRTVNATSPGLSTEPVRMQWNFRGDFNPTTAEMIDHLSEHGVDATGMTRQEMAATHDRLHNGYSTQAACPTCPQPQLRRRGGRFFGLFGR